MFLKTVRIRIFLGSVMLACLIALPAFAYQPLTFRPIDTITLKIFLKDLAQESVYATADLNGDGAEEIIVRRCPTPDAKAYCSFDIYAENSGDYLSLGHIEAFRLEIARTKKNGIYSLMSYEDPINDYKYKLYVWDFALSRYNGEL